jgi:hypothetical protein
MNKQLLEAMQIARYEGFVAAKNQALKQLQDEMNWASSKEGDDEYHRGLRDGMVRAWEAVGRDRWKRSRDTTSGK